VVRCGEVIGLGKDKEEEGIHRDGGVEAEGTATPIEIACCASCGMMETTRPLKRCARCHTMAASFCSVACQTRAWPEHRLVCQSS
jgi:hypothetical protein